MQGILVKVEHAIDYIDKTVSIQEQQTNTTSAGVELREGLVHYYNGD